MIIDYEKDPETARGLSVFDARTGECLDKSLLYYFADDVAGYLLCRKRDEKGRRYLWDSRTHERIDGVIPESDPRSPFIEVAWERVDRKIVIRPKECAV
jgi:hypothetical protein